MIEFLIASGLLLAITISLFGVMNQIQLASSYQTEVHAVMDNARIALDTVGRILRQAGNDPGNTGFRAITIIGPSEVRIRSDLTGQTGIAGGDPDKGDPDGDTNDSGEDVTVRYNADTQGIELVSSSGNVQTIASNISAFSMQYWDASGALTWTGSNVQRITLSLTGSAAAADAQTRQIFSIQLNSEVLLDSRR